MKTTLVFLVVLLTVSITTVSSQNSKEDIQDEFNKKISAISFQENKGQIKDQHWQPRPDILYSGESQGLIYHLKKNGWHYQLSQLSKWRQSTEEENYFRKEQEQIAEEITIYRLDVNLLHSNSDVKIESTEELPGYTNYYNVPDGVEPALFVKKYSTVTYNNIYKGIDLVFYESKDGQLEYDFIVAPGADYKQIQLQFEGAEIKINEQNELILETPLGTIVEGPLKVFQGDKSIAAKWKLNEESNSISLEIPNYDKSLPLRIDPLVRVWGTYYGGSGDDVAYSCITDTLGNVYLAGYTGSINNIATSGAHQIIYGGDSDAFFLKFNNYGFLMWGTYYGGNGHDYGTSCCVGIDQSLYFSGYTSSISAIATVGVHQDTFAGGNYDAFLVCFDSLGQRQWGTYYGGSDWDKAFSCSVDRNGNSFIVGETKSIAGISSTGAHQSIYGGGGKNDAFLVCFDSLGQRQWGTYYGGTGADIARSCCVDNLGYIYMAGQTESITAITTQGAHQTIFGGITDAFLVKFNNSGVRQWGSYYGGNGGDYAFSCAIDAFGNVYFGGYTNSTSNMSSLGVHQDTIGGGSDAFLVRFDSLGQRKWGSYYGGSGNDVAYSCTTDALGNVFLTGRTHSVNAISTISAHQIAHGGGWGDAYLVQFDSSGVRKHGTYYGGDETDQGNSCCCDSNGNIYIAGSTESANAIVSFGAHQLSYGGGNFDGFIVQLYNCNTFASINPIVCKTYTSPSGNYTWTTSGVYYDTIPNMIGCDSIITINLTINTVDTAVSIAGITLTATLPGVSYQWLDCNNAFALLSGETSQAFTATVNGSYAVEVTENGCTDTSNCHTINGVGIQEQTNSNIHVYPNPARESFTIIGLEQGMEIRLMDMHGREVLKKNASEETALISLEGIAYGVYLVSVRSNNMLFQTKLIVARR